MPKPVVIKLRSLPTGRLFASGWLPALLFPLTIAAGLASTPVFAADNLHDQGILAWLTAPLDPSRPHEIDGTTAWHGRLMVAVWLLLFPAGVIMARFFKITPAQNWPCELDNKRWWRTHLATQYAGGALLLIALGLALQAASFGEAGFYHRLFGWLAMALAGWQFLGGWLRGSKGGPTDPRPDGSLHGDHYDMTHRRLLFEFAHKFGGYLALLVAWIAIPSGLWLVNAPRWMGLSLILCLVLLIGLAIRFQIRGYARDTYEAIWGPGREHPGNRRPPIGFGVNRKGNQK